MQSTRGPRNALHEAALCGRPQQVKDLLGGPIDINGGTLLDGSTPLMLAAQEGRSEIVRILLESGANVKMSAEQGFTCLHIAAEQGHFQVVVDLVNSGAEVDARNHNGDRALHLAAMNGNVDVVTALITAGGAHLEAPNKRGFTPLHTSAQYGRWRATKALIFAGAKVNSRLPDGATPLYLASERGHTVAVRVLCRAKANALLPFMTPWGEPRAPLELAALGGHSGVVRELLEPGGIWSCGGASGGVDALSGAAEKGHLDILAMLAEAGVVDNGTALLRAAGVGETATVKFLLRQHSSRGPSSSTTTDKGVAYVNTRNSTGRTPLFCNIMLPYCSPKMVRLLVDAGADVASAFPINQAGRVFFDDTALTLATTQLRRKMVNGQPATEEQLDRLEAIRRLLLRVEAVRAVSWLWTSDGSHLGNNNTRAEEGNKNSDRTSTAPSAQLTSMLPIMRRRAGRRGVLLSALFRNARKP